jgi:hypothetical protein
MNGMLPAEEIPFQRGVGIFLRNSERGFRGLDFQARLSWEDRYGACGKPRWVTQDFVDRLSMAAVGTPGSTARDMIAALKDRLVGEPAIDAGAEAAALTAIVGSLDGPAAGVSIASLRRVCGALLGSPQFLMQGIAGKGGDRPKLTPPNAGYDATCVGLAAGIGTPGLVVTCANGTLTLAAGRVAPAAPPPTVPARAAPLERTRRITDPRRVPAPTQ